MVGLTVVGLISLGTNGLLHSLLTVHVFKLCFGCLSIAVIELLEVECGLLRKQMMQCVQVGELHSIDIAVCLCSSVVLKWVVLLKTADGDWMLCSNKMAVSVIYNYVQNIPLLVYSDS